MQFVALHNKLILVIIETKPKYAKAKNIYNAVNKNYDHEGKIMIKIMTMIIIIIKTTRTIHMINIIIIIK